MQILTWNIQYAKGVDNVVDVERIVNDIKALADADIICLQEVLVTPEAQQVAQLAEYFPEHTPVFGSAIDRLCSNGRLLFGNLILCRLPILQVTQHKLPQPSEPDVKHMPRQAIELLVEYKAMPIRVVTTHLDYFAQKQRSAQVNYLLHHHDECLQRYSYPSPQGGDGQFETLPETAFTIYCGDFNLPVNSADYNTLLSCTDSNSQSVSHVLSDCWVHLYPDKAHAPTCGIYDVEQWEEGPHCRDFFFASQEAIKHVVSLVVDTKTAASDHQPLVLTLS